MLNAVLQKHNLWRMTVLISTIKKKKELGYSRSSSYPKIEPLTGLWWTSKSISPFVYISILNSPSPKARWPPVYNFWFWAAGVLKLVAAVISSAPKYRITECSGLGGTFRGRQAQPPCNEQRHLQPDQVAQSPVQPGLECFQGWGIDHLSGQPGPGFHHP